MKITELTNTSCPRTKAKQCQCESVNALTESQDTVFAVVSELIHSDKVKGQILFMQQADGPTLIKGRVTGLEPGKHGFHVHQFGDLSDGCDSAGPHFDPDGVDHGDLDKGHVGDLGNITANTSGIADFTIVAKRVDLVGDRSIVGRAIVIHADEDDLGKGGDEESLKTGNAGERVACGIITLKDKSGE
jgi:Cu-Zn family superoxide dismutase